MIWTSLTIRERLYAHSIPEPNSGCWIWTKSLHANGYPQIVVRAGRAERGNIVSYRLHKGDIPRSLLVRHTCDCRWCVNPDHLILGTYQDNVDDAVARGRHVRGERVGSARLSEADVIAIRADPRGHSVVAAQYGVTKEMVGHIRARRRWKHLLTPTMGAS